MDSIEYLKNTAIELAMPFDFNITTQTLKLAKTRLNINELVLQLKFNHESQQC